MSHRHRSPRSLVGYWLRHRSSTGFRLAVIAALLLVALGLGIGFTLAGMSGPAAHRAQAPASSSRTPTSAATPLTSAGPTLTSAPTPVPSPRAGRGTSGAAPAARATATATTGASSTPAGSAPGTTGRDEASTSGGTGQRTTSAPPATVPAAPTSVPLSPHPKPATGPTPRSPRPHPSSTPAPKPSPKPTRAARPTPAPAPPDTVAPQTSAWTVSAANGFWTIGLAADEPAGFRCSLDGGGWTSCTSPLAYGPMHPGPHTFAVRATDAAGNTDPSPATLIIKFKGNGSGHRPGRLMPPGAPGGWSGR